MAGVGGTRIPFLGLLISSVLIFGCSDGDSEPGAVSESAQASAGVQNDSVGGPDRNAPSDALGEGSGQTPADGPGYGLQSAPVPASPGFGGLVAEETPPPVGVPDVAQGGSETAGEDDRRLRDDLTADQLAEILESSDRDMETIASGRAKIQDPRQAGELMRKIAAIKLDAAVRLQSQGDATEAQQIEGLRGQLQALSHLAAMGDLASAKALKSLARDNLQSDEPTVAGDSRIVLIGFAIDELQAGGDSAADEIVELIDGMSLNPKSDVPSVLMMARARQVLSNYGFVNRAAKVRDKILTLYGNSSDAMIAQVAADAAGTAKYDAISRLLGAIISRDDVALERWTVAVDELLVESPDMNAVQFLASSALQLEAAGRDAFVEETFKILKQQFDDPQSATANEIRAAATAMEARKDVIGTPLDFDDLPTVNGEGVPESDLQGKVVLMPFWAISIPESLQLVGMLKEIRDNHPAQVSIVGMNLDPEQAPLEEFLAQNDLEFASYRSISSTAGDVPNPVASKFGLVSMPFVAVFDKEGKVAALDFTGRELHAVVESLIGNGTP